MPCPTPGIHLAVSRSRLGEINDVSRNSLLVNALKKAFSALASAPVCLCVSELSILPLIAAKLGAKKVYVSEKNNQMRSVLDQISKENGLEAQLAFVGNKGIAELTKADLPEPVDLLIGEPFFSATLLPWHNLLYWYCLASLRDQQAVMPIRAEIWAMAVHYQDLWKIRSPVKQAEGFRMRQFDDLIMVKKIFHV